ncbi:outer membrane beta-barrel protein [Calycomorphotria hydatis]|nr:outer membrane beta-barrel protein [Calycomorphotria hydatis]
MNWSTSLRCLWAGALGLVFINPAFGGAFDSVLKGSCCDTCCDEVCCDGPSCEAPCGDACCDDVCCDAVCCDGCADACGWCNLGEPYSLMDMFCCDPGFTVGGWTQWGYTTQSTGQFNSIPDRINNHQSWLYIEKVADGSCGVGFGGRVDIMYGTDFDDTNSFGNNPGVYDFTNALNTGGGYGWAFPQLYGEVAMGDLSVIAGHFYTLVGYEVVTAPDNFFYSHAFTMYNSEPFTHTGVLATYSGMDGVELYAGWTLGWDTGFDQAGAGSNFLGGASMDLGCDASLTYIVTAGDFGDTQLGNRGSGYSHSVVLDVNLSDNMNYVFQTDYVDANTADALQYGINQYLFYTINDCLAAGARFEWWRPDTAQGQVDVYEFTAGVNVRPHANLVIRPEWRYQWASNDVLAAGAVGDGSGLFNGSIFGVDAILTF